jgi:hypothetical protein
VDADADESELLLLPQPANNVPANVTASAAEKIFLNFILLPP